MTDWARTAAPQADHYDTGEILRLVQATPPFGAPYVRRPVGFGAVLCDGRVSVRHTGQRIMGLPRYEDAVVDHPNLLLAAGYLRRWPVGYEQFGRLIDTVHPLTDTTVTVARRAVHLGASSGSDEACSLCATVDSALGLSQAMVHRGCRLRDAAKAPPARDRRVGARA